MMSRSKKLIVALLLSLIVNGALVGLFVGHRLAGEERHAMHGMARQLLQDEPKDLAQPVREAMQAHRSELRQAFKKLRRARREMAEILKDPQATEADISVGFTAIRMADNNLKALSHRVLASVLPTLPPEQRLAFAIQETGRMHHGKPKARPPH
jgi:uncharacterized membrane protein